MIVYMCAKFYFQFKSISRVVVAFAVSTLRYGAIAVGVAQLYEIMVLPSRATRFIIHTGGNILSLVYMYNAIPVCDMFTTQSTTFTTSNASTPSR